MKNKGLFDKTVAILVRAYFDKTLAHGDCACCAVGNLVCAGYGDKLPSQPYGRPDLSKYREWGYLSAYGIPSNRRLANQNVEVTGYSERELILIEEAFECGNNNIHWTQYSCKTDSEIESIQYAGLMRVLDCLMQIHEADETEIKEAKELFMLK